MSTNAIIVAKLSNGMTASIYLHYDGYDEYAGHMLRTHYTTQVKIDALMALGDLSVLGSDPVAVDMSHNVSCVAYHRDRHESYDRVKAMLSCSFKAIMDDAVDFCSQYIYVWDGVSWTTKTHE